jgi:hypothetical protein
VITASSPLVTLQFSQYRNRVHKLEVSLREQDDGASAFHAVQLHMERGPDLRLTRLASRGRNFFRIAVHRPIYPFAARDFQTSN